MIMRYNCIVISSFRNSLVLCTAAHRFAVRQLSPQQPVPYTMNKICELEERDRRGLISCCDILYFSLERGSGQMKAIALSCVVNVKRLNPPKQDQFGKHKEGDLWKLICLVLTLRSLTSTLFPQSTMGISSHTLTMFQCQLGTFLYVMR